MATLDSEYKLYEALTGMKDYSKFRSLFEFENYLNILFLGFEKEVSENILLMDENRKIEYLLRTHERFKQIKEDNYVSSDYIEKFLGILNVTKRDLNLFFSKKLDAYIWEEDTNGKLKYHLDEKQFLFPGIPNLFTGLDDTLLPIDRFNNILNNIWALQRESSNPVLFYKMNTTIFGKLNDIKHRFYNNYQWTVVEKSVSFLGGLMPSINPPVQKKNLYDSFELNDEMTKKYESQGRALSSALNDMMKDLKATKDPFITEETELQQFKCLFNNQPVLPKIKWTGTVGELHYFIDLLDESKIKKLNLKIWSVTVKCFEGKNAKGKPFNPSMLKDGSKTPPSEKRKTILKQAVAYL